MFKSKKEIIKDYEKKIEYMIIELDARIETREEEIEDLLLRYDVVKDEERRKRIMDRIDKDEEVLMVLKRIKEDFDDILK